MKKTFDEFYKSFGLKEYPFSVYTAEKEGEKTKYLFVKPSEFSILESTLRANNSAIIVGNRGSGKTLLLKEINRGVNGKKLLLTINNFEKIALKDNVIDYHNHILKALIDALIVYLLDKEKNIKKLDSDNKLFLSFLIYKYADNITEEQIKKRIETVQLGKFKRFLKSFSKPINALLNYGATAITNFGNELLTKKFGDLLPQADESVIKSIFPDIEFGVDKDFINKDSSYKLISKALLLAKKLEVESIIVQIDKLDEEARLVNDAELVSKFIEPLFLGNQLLLNENIQLIISVWKIPFDLLRSKFRKQKHFVYTIDWSIENLKLVLDQRLQVHSDNKNISFKDMIDSTVDEENIEEIFKLANSNPRDLWHIWHEIFRAQYNEDANSTQICQKAINDALQEFVTTFDFYEYYPKKKGSRQNSNDVYSYVQHLLKLSDVEFTHNQLKEEASTGGSTRNYITGMQNIGLVKKMSHKREGSVLYLIKDPKVVYALQNNLDIDK